eukprot:Gb_19296 [translate_table: standard]
MNEFGNPGFSEWLKPQISDTEYLLLTGMNSQHLENSLGASLLTMEGRGEIRQQRVGEEEPTVNDLRKINPGISSGGEVNSNELRAQLNVTIPHQCYKSPENGACFEDGYPLLIPNKRGSEFESYHEPFRIGSFYETQHSLDCSGGDEILSLAQDIDVHYFIDSKPVPLFEQSSKKKYELNERINENAREKQACVAGSTKRYGNHNEYSNENGREKNQACDAGSMKEHEIYMECLNGNTRENRACNAGDMKEYGCHIKCLNENARESEVCHAGTMNEYEIHKEDCNENARENQECDAGSTKDDESQKEWSNDNARGNDVCNSRTKEYESRKEFSNEIARGNQASNAGNLLPVITGITEDLEMATQKEHLCYAIAQEIDSVLETNREIDVQQEDDSQGQQSPIEVSFKPIARKSLRRKKQSSSRKRVSKKTLDSQKRENIVPSVGSESNLLNTNISEGLVVSNGPEIEDAPGPTCSGSVVASTGLLNDGNNKGDLKLQSASDANNTDCGVSVSSSNKVIVGEIIGRITRSRALGRPYKKTAVRDALSEENNAIFANKMTGKRSVLCKTVRSTKWGGLENLRQGLEKKGMALESDLYPVHSELGKTDLEAELPQNQGGRKRASGVRGRRPQLDDGQSELFKLTVSGSHRKCSKRKNGKQGNAVVQELGSVSELTVSRDQDLNVQGGHVLCFLRDHAPGGGARQKSPEEEHGSLKNKRDQCHIDQTCHLPLEVPKLVGKAEEGTHRHTCDQTICAHINETKHHISTMIRADASHKEVNENGQYDSMVYEKESNVSQKEQVAITVQEMCEIPIYTRTKPLEKEISSPYACVDAVFCSEDCRVNMESGLTEMFRNQKCSQDQTEAIDVKDGSGSSEMNMPITKIQEQVETRTCYSEIMTTEMHLNGLSGSGMSTEAVVDTCSMEHGDDELHDMVSATSHVNAARAGIMSTVGHDSRRKKGKKKGKIKGKSEPAGENLGILEVPEGNPNTVQDKNATGKMTKSRCKQREKNASLQGRKLCVKNQKKLLHADGGDRLIVINGVPSVIVERRASHELQDMSKGEERPTYAREETTENAFLGNLKMEDTISTGKRQAGKLLKNSRRRNRKTDLMGSTSTHDIKSKYAGQKINIGDKKSSCNKNKGVQKGLQTLARNNGQLGKGVCNLLSGDDPNTIGTEQGKEVIGELPGFKGPSDCFMLTTLIGEPALADASLSLKTACRFENGQKIHGVSNFDQGFIGMDFLKNKTLEKQRLVGCNNEVAGEDVSSGVTEGEANRIMCTGKKCDESVQGYCGLPRVGWVLCDDCHKWRCIPVELADAIDGANCKWTCRDNPNKEFADCSIPQEKSNAEINAELNISDVSCEEGDCNGVRVNSKDLACTRTPDSQQAVWTHIKHNMFLHRSRKTQIIDEIMVCHCKPPEDGSLGCGDGCLNRMLNIECVQGTCPCGELCSNQQFQKRLYAEVEWFRCGKKGFGLQVLKDISKGLFLIEYVGEVLDMEVYEARQKEYASRGQKHFYFMTLNSNEVIDACVKGNLGRFINHSCNPNCRTEKWMVNGEVCIGLFAIRDIKKGEEVTFDYNYVRVFGAAAKKCECGSLVCRGFIGGDPSTPAGVVQSESDEDFPAPVMLQEESENDSAQDEKVLTSKVHGPSDKSVQGELSFQPAELKRKCSRDAFEKERDASKGSTVMKKANGSSTLGKGLNLKKSVVQANGGHFEGVEEKLNEMLDSEGGISKRKDAGKHYLKLLLVTAASGDTVNGEASRSTRDLSMVLDALLKTRSRTVLNDIMSKNGLQMLHNMMKQNRWNYNKIPIIRKLLKVLEFLATKDVLTQEHINSGPPCRGKESFRDSIFTLTGHNDRQVQKIARCFRDNWIPRPIKKYKKRERVPSFQVGATSNDYQKNRCKFSAKRRKNLVPRQTDAIDCTSQQPREPENVVQSHFSGSDQYEVQHGMQDTFPCQDSSVKQDVDVHGQMKVIKKRKRKTRWDQPTEPAVMHQYPAQMTLEGVESNMQPEKESVSLVVDCQRDTIPSAEQDVHNGADVKCASEQKYVTTMFNKNISCQSITFSNQICEQMSTSNRSEACVKGQSSFQCSMQENAQLPGHIQPCMSSSHATSCLMNMPVPPSYMMAFGPSPVYGYAVGNPQGTFQPHLPLSYGIPLYLLEQPGRLCALPDCTAQASSPLRPRCESNSNSVTMLPDLPYRPCSRQPMVPGMPQHPHHQSGAQIVPFPMQTTSCSFLSGQQQAMELHRREQVGQCGSEIPDYMEPEPPVPGLSPTRSSEMVCNTIEPNRGRSKAAFDQTVQTGKRHWKQHRQSNFRGYSKFHGHSDRKYKDRFHQKKSFKATWKGRFSNFHRDQNLHNASNQNIFQLKKEQQKPEHMNTANFLNDVDKNFSTFHQQQNFANC